MIHYGALEAGGTKMVLSLMAEDGTMLERVSMPTLTPAETMPGMIDFFRQRNIAALGIGCFQVLSLVPGTSRSGSTIIGGLLLGCTRSVASKFTFFLAIPVMFGASALKLVKYFIKGGTFGTNEIAILGVGCVVAFVVSLIAIKWLMGFVRRHDFKCFGVYRIILGIVVLAYFFVLEPMLGL